MIEVRAVGGGEAMLLRELRLRALTEAPAAFASTLEHEARFPDAHWTELAAAGERRDTAAIVAVDGERWVGMAAARWLERERATVHLWGMWVEPALRRRGIGERLVAAVRRWAGGQGARFVRLGVVDDLEGAAQFYERLGFVRTGECKPLERDDTITAVFLVRPV